MRWLQVPEFQAATGKSSARGIRAIHWATTARGVAAAATTLLKTMIDPGTPASVRVRAAECVLNHAAKAIEIDDIEARLSALEAATRDRIQTTALLGAGLK